MADGMPTDHENQSAAYWRGETNARLKGVEQQTLEIRQAIRESVESMNAGIQQNRQEVRGQIESLQEEIADATKTLYKIIGFGLAAATVATFLLKVFFPA